MHEFYKSFDLLQEQNSHTQKCRETNQKTKTKRKNNIQKSVPEINAFCYFVFSQQFK